MRLKRRSFVVAGIKLIDGNGACGRLHPDAGLPIVDELDACRFESMAHGIQICLWDIRAVARLIVPQVLQGHIGGFGETRLRPPEKAARGTQLSHRDQNLTPMCESLW